MLVIACVLLDQTHSRTQVGASFSVVCSLVTQHKSLCVFMVLFSDWFGHQDRILSCGHTAATDLRTQSGNALASA